MLFIASLLSAILGSVFLARELLKKKLKNCHLFLKSFLGNDFLYDHGFTYVVSSEHRRLYYFSPFFCSSGSLRVLHSHEEFGKKENFLLDSRFMIVNSNIIEFIEKVIYCIL
jgi:hypothetical protein